MKEFRTLYPGCENAEPTKPSVDNSNHTSSVHGSRHNGINTVEGERSGYNIEMSDYVGQDNRQSGIEAVDFSTNRRPNAEVLAEEIDNQIREIIKKNFERYMKSAQQSDNFPIGVIQADIFNDLYGHIEHPSETDLVKTFTVERIKKVLYEVMSEGV